MDVNTKIKIELTPSQCSLICYTIQSQIKEIEKNIKLFKSHDVSLITPETCDSIAECFEQDKADLESILKQIYKGGV